MSKSRIVNLSHLVEKGAPESVEVEQTATFDHEARRANAIRTQAIRVGGTTYDVTDANNLRDALTEAIDIASADFGEV